MFDTVRVCGSGQAIVELRYIQLDSQRTVTAVNGGQRIRDQCI